MELEVGVGTRTKSLDEWNSKDILLYFAHRWKERTGRVFQIPNEAWPGFMSRISSFKRKTGMSGSEYKQFIDSVVDDLFSEPKFVPNFGCIVSEKVLWVVREGAKLETTEEDFLRLKRELHANNALYQIV